jgi:hypothetical protein
VDAEGKLNIKNQIAKLQIKKQKQEQHRDKINVRNKTP